MPFLEFLILPTLQTLTIIRYEYEDKFNGEIFPKAVTITWHRTYRVPAFLTARYWYTVSVRLSVCPTVQSWYCSETVVRIITSWLGPHSVKLVGSAVGSVNRVTSGLQYKLFIIIQGGPEKTAQTLMRYNFSTAGHRVTRFSAKCSETNW